MRPLRRKPKRPWRYPRPDRDPGAPALVPYPKGMKTFREQAETLVARGMIGDVAEIERRLVSTNYYRLSGYFYFFREHQGRNRHLGEQFRAGTTFEAIWTLYRFDSQLRALIGAAIEKIEVAARTQISYHHGHKFGPFGYALHPHAMSLGDRVEWDHDRREEVAVDRRDDFLTEVEKSLERSREQFVDHFYDTYDDEYPPIYIASEVLTLGCIKHVFQGAPEDVQRAIANHFQLAPTVLESWLLTLNTARNVCAHHGRFWNRSLGGKPKPPKDPMFHSPVEIFAKATQDPTTGKWVQPPTTFAIASMCNYLLDVVDRGSGWAKQLKRLLDDHPGVKKIAMGFPDNWTSSPVWYDVD